ncbi:RagB/SusD family nutrient uptake outer membrane protein [Chitinophagaceae bacterium LWZ2-11]
MKRLIYFILIISIGLASCQKFLTTQPTDFLTPNQYYANQTALLTALAGVYNPLAQSSLYGDAMYDALGACTDEGFYGRSTQTTGVPVYNFDYTNVDIGNFWTALYTGIERANELITRVNPADTTAATQAMIGEALFLRGYYHFLLVSNFGDVPLKITPTTDINNVNIPRTPTKDVYAQILKDMQAAEAKVLTASTLNYSSRVSKTTVEGVLARVCLTMAGYPLQDQTKYADALSWANKVQASNLHALNANYSQIFINEAQDIYDVKEAMWEADFSGNNSTSQPAAGRLGNTNGIAFSAATVNPASGNVAYVDTGYSYGFIYATGKLYNLYGTGDTRRDWSIATYSYSGMARSYFTGAFAYNRNCGKWRRSYEILTPKNKNYTPTNFPLLRYSDVLLMLAEAENQVTGPDAVAYNAVNMVRRRAYGLPVGTASPVADLPAGLSQSQFLQAIQDERARELCFEALRRPDLIRWGIFINTMKTVGADIAANGGSFKYGALGFTNVAQRNLLFPIPAAEITVNKAITQNTGW